MLASPTSRWTMGAVMLTLLVLVASWLLLISPRRADATAVREQAEAQRNQANVLQQQIISLRAEFSELPARKAELAAIGRQLPPAAQIPALVRSLQQFALASGVSIDALAPGTPVVVNTTAGAAGAAATTAAAGQVVSVPISLTVSGDYFEDALFIKALQTKLDRAILISSLNSSKTAGSSVSAPAGTPAAGASAAAAPMLTSLQIMASVFVLMDGSSTLDDVAGQAKSAAVTAVTGATATPASAT
jgi:Tfp pilus assembly protein PilO